MIVKNSGTLKSEDAAYRREKGDKRETQACADLDRRSDLGYAPHHSGGEEGDDRRGDFALKRFHDLAFL